MERDSKKGQKTLMDGCRTLGVVCGLSCQMLGLVGGVVVVDGELAGAMGVGDEEGEMAVVARDGEREHQLTPDPVTRGDGHRHPICACASSPCLHNVRDERRSLLQSNARSLLGNIHGILDDFLDMLARVDQQRRRRRAGKWLHQRNRLGPQMNHLQAEDV